MMTQSITKNTRKYATNTNREIHGKSQPSEVARMISEEWVSGRDHITVPMTLGRESTENRVPHMNVIGRMTMLEIMFRVGLEPARRPAITPNMENVTLQKKMQIKRPRVMCTCGSRRHPSPNIMNAPISPFSIPMTDFPKIMEGMCIGHRMSSSKLE